MELIIRRALPIGLAIPGDMFMEGAHAAFTLERVGVEISPGTYDITTYLSPHFGQLMPWVHVPEREYILIHWGNYPTNSDGCILVGDSQDPATGDLWNTRKKWSELMPAIEGAIDGGESCTLTIG